MNASHIQSITPGEAYGCGNQAQVVAVVAERKPAVSQSPCGVTADRQGLAGLGCYETADVDTG